MHAWDVGKTIVRNIDSLESNHHACMQLYMTLMVSAVFEQPPFQYNSQELGMIFLSSRSFWTSLQINSRAYFTKKTDKRALHACTVGCHYMLG